MDICSYCNEAAAYLDMVRDEPVPYCSTCLGDALIGLELDKGRVVGVDEWKEEHAEA